MDEFEQKLLEQHERESTKWTFRRDVSVGNVITIAFVLFTAIAAYFSINTRTTILENSLAAQRQTDERQDAESVRREVQTSAALERIAAKLDRIMESRRP